MPRTRAIRLIGPGFAQTLDVLLASWLKQAVNDCVAEAKARCRSPQVQFLHVATGKRGMIAVGGIASTRYPFRMADWAFGENFKVPVGGFKPALGERGIYMRKPEGEVWRARTYTKYSGQTVKPAGYGYLRDAILATFTQARLELLGERVAAFVTVHVVAMLKKYYERRGYTVVVT